MEERKEGKRDLVAAISQWIVCMAVSDKIEKTSKYRRAGGSREEVCQCDNYSDVSPSAKRRMVPTGRALQGMPSVTHHCDGGPFSITESQPLREQCPK